ncbi:MAG: ComF family protein [Planctomycetaceae bacterium]
MVDSPSPSANSLAASASPSQRRSLVGRVGSALRQVVDDFANFVYPPSCAACGAESLAQSGLCAECVAAFAPRRPTCRRCSAPVGPHLETSSGCFHCREDRFAFARVFALGAYDGRLRDAVLRCKQPYERAVGLRMGELLADRWLDELSALQFDVLLPVPQHWLGRLVSPQPATGLIADGLGQRLSVPIDEQVLVKSRRTAPQASLPPTQRRNNLRDAFRVTRGTRLGGCRVLLVDDVLTTGTTAHRCSRVLLESGAASVHVAVLARGLGR